MATLGTATTPVHVQKLLRQADEVVFCFDGDAAGPQAAWRALEVSLPLARRRASRSASCSCPRATIPTATCARTASEAFERELGAGAAAVGVPARRAARASTSQRPRAARAVQVSAKPLVQQLAAPVLRMQLVQRARAAGADRAGRCRAAARRARGAAVPRRRRRAGAPDRAPIPRPERAATCCAACSPTPALAAELDVELLDPSMPEAHALRAHRGGPRAAARRRAAACWSSRFHGTRVRAARAAARRPRRWRRTSTPRSAGARVPPGRSSRCASRRKHREMRVRSRGRLGAQSGVERADSIASSKSCAS